MVQPGAVYASQTLRFEAPVYVGDGAVAEVRPGGTPSSFFLGHIAVAVPAVTQLLLFGSVKFATKCFTSQGEDDGETLAIEGEAMAFLPTLELSPEVAPIAR
jgi:acyl dehydratase